MVYWWPKGGRIIPIDPWAHALATRLSAKHGLLASEIYAWAIRARPKADEKIIDDLAEKLAESAESLGQGFQETLTQIVDNSTELEDS